MKSSPLARKTPLKRAKRRKLSSLDRNRAGAFRRAAAREFCAVCGAIGPLIAPVDAHHVVAAQWLRRNAPGSVYDARNVLPVCRDCHERHENASRRIPLSALTEQNLEFAREVLGAAADHYLGRRYPAIGPPLPSGLCRTTVWVMDCAPCGAPSGRPAARETTTTRRAHERADD